MVGRHIRTKSGLLGAISARPASRPMSSHRQALAGAARLRGHRQVRDYKARTLSYGDQRAGDRARARDDPQLIAPRRAAAGMNATEKVVLRELIDRIRKDNRTILLIEHDVKLVMGCATASRCWTTASRSPRARPTTCSATRR
jgi:branched-chain amino acid transport system ATP-binding protein